MKIGPKITADLSKLIDSKLLIQANSGGGKSWAIRRILEQSHGKVQQIILDPEGEFGTLREKYEYILCGKDQDAPADVRSAALLARKLLEVKTSAIIDLYELHPQDRKKFVRLFLEAMINAPKDLWHPVLVVIDEAHTFAPEKGESEALNAVIGLASLGRKRGFGAILATQRISKLHKDAAAECNNKLIGRTGLDIDRKRAGEELGFSAKEDVLSLRTLEPGEFYAFGPAISSEVIRGSVGEVETSHPKAGSRILTNTVPPTDKIKKILAQLADLPQEAKKEAETIQSLKAELSLVKKQLSTDKKAIVNPIVNRAVIDREVRAALIANNKHWDAVTKDFDRKWANTMWVFSQIKKLIPNEEGKFLVKSPREAAKAMQKFILPVAKEVINTGIVKVAEGVDSAMFNDFRPSKSQQKILNVLSWAEQLNISPTDKTQVALLAEQRPTSGGYKNNVGALRSAGLISYPTPGTIELTEKGRELAIVSDMPTSDEELHNALFKRLSVSQVPILKTLIEIYPESISKSELAQHLNVQETSGGYKNNLGLLRSLKLIDYPTPGNVVALPVLFLDK